MGSTSKPITVRSDVQVSGPLCLSTDEPESLTWLARTGSFVVGWVKLCRPNQHVGLLRELHLSEPVCNSISVATRLCNALYDYARDHGLLKLRIHRDCMHECLYEALERAGFSHDGQGASGRMVQVYVDLYRGPRGRHSDVEEQQTRASEIRLAS